MTTELSILMDEGMTEAEALDELGYHPCKNDGRTFKTSQCKICGRDLYQLGFGKFYHFTAKEDWEAAE